MIITTLMARNVYEQDDHYQSGAKKWSGFGLTNRTGSAGPGEEVYWAGLKWVTRVVHLSSEKLIVYMYVFSWYF